MRRAVTLLQSCVNFHGKQDVANMDFLEELSGDVPSSMMTLLWDAISAKDNDAMARAVNEIMRAGGAERVVRPRFREG